MVIYMKLSFLLCVLLALSSAEARAQKKRLPIIDMHMHARTAHHYGPNPGPMCAPVEKMPTWDPAKPFGEALKKYEPPCKRPVQPAATDAEVMGPTIERAPFLGPRQKRDIFYNNAARFLRLSPQEIARHHRM